VGRPRGSVLLAHWHKYPTIQEAGRELAGAVASLLSAAVARNGHASLAVPGGTTPSPFLAALSDKDLPWGQVTLMPTDERFVEPHEEQSNERMILACMPAIACGLARWVSFHVEGATLGAAAIELDIRVRSLPPLDVVVLGMGADGHIASLFPGDPFLGVSAGQHVVPTRPVGLSPRLSLSPERLVAAGRVFLLVAGEAKRNALERATGQTPLEAPVSLLLRRPEALNIYWSANG
jgi:6-phosphogluconolactonase